MKKKYVLIFTGLLFVLNVFAWQEVFYLSGKQNLKVNFLAVGQGDAVFIETPEKFQILIDGGPDSTVLSKLQKIMPVFDRSIDVVILTHPEKDHLTGLIDVLQRYKVDYVLWTGAVKNSAEYKKWVEILNKKQKEKTKIITAFSGMKIKAGRVLIDTLFPFENLQGKEFKNTSNDTCIVSRLVFGSNSFLFTGDITSKAEKALANSYELASLKSDVLKVAHHGSKYSTSDLFLQNVKPKIAVIEVGKNSYGHPTPETLQRLEKFGIKTFRTDKDGDVKIESNGKNIKIIN